MIYLDANATTAISHNAFQAMQDVYSIGCVNPSSIHSAGKLAKKLYQKAKEDILRSLNAEGYDLVFVSSGTEANNLALYNKKILTTATEHESIRNQPLQKTLLTVNGNGIVNVNQFEELAKNHAFSSIIWSNNQTGVVQDIPSMIKVKDQCLLHTDAVQYAGKRHIDLQNTPVDAITISSHKIHGPCGIACLVFKKNYPITPMIFGGSQENSLHAGTHNLPAIVGFSTALAKVNSHEYIENYHYHTTMLTNEISNFVQNNGGEIVAKNSNRLSNTLCIIKKNTLTTEQILMMDINNICISAGSACSAGVVGKSYVLQAMGLDSEDIACAIRVSVDISNSIEEVQEFCQIWKNL